VCDRERGRERDGEREREREQWVGRERTIPIIVFFECSLNRTVEFRQCLAVRFNLLHSVVKAALHFFLKYRKSRSKCKQIR